MKCFGKYIKSKIKCIEDLEITVHCQISTFKWLVDYTNNPSKNWVLDMKNIHSILTSSDYLDMPKLSNLWVEFIVDNIQSLLSSSNGSQKDPIPTYKSHIAKNISRKFCERNLHCCKYRVSNWWGVQYSTMDMPVLPQDPSISFLENISFLTLISGSDQDKIFMWSYYEHLINLLFSDGYTGWWERCLNSSPFQEEARTVLWMSYKLTFQVINV